MAGFISAIVLLGWLLDIRVFKSVLPGFITMKANTALCFAMATAAMWLSRTRSSRKSNRTWVGILALAIIAIAVITLGEYAFHWNAGIDEFLFHDPEHEHTDSPTGRLAPGTALCFLFLSFALLLFDSWPRTSHVLVLTALLGSLIGLIGYLDNLPTLSGAIRYTSMALHTVFAFIAVCVGLLASRPERGFTALLFRSGGRGESNVKATAAGAVVLPIALGSLTLWGERRGWYGHEFTLALFSVLLIVLNLGLVALTERERRKVEAKRRHAESIRRTAEIALGETEERFRILADNIPNLSWMAHADGHIFWYNRQWHHYTGTTPEEMEGWGWRTVHHPDYLDEVVSRWKVALERGHFFEMEFPLRGSDGEFRWFLTQVRPVRNAAGEIIRWFGTNTNIDDKRKAAEELRQQWQTFDAALSHTPDLTYTFNLDGRFTYANRALLRLLGKSLDEVVGRNLFDAGYSAHVAQRVSAQIKQVVVTKENVRGEIRHYEYILAPVLAANGDVIAVTGSTRDISERKQNEEKERQRQEQLRETARLESLGVMAGAIAHDFNNLLTGILGNASLLSLPGHTDTASIAAEIVLAAERAADLTRQMLAFSGKGKFLIEVLDVNAHIRENLILLRASISRAVTVALDLSEEALLVDADKAQMQQVIMNLLINASDAMGDTPGSVFVRTRRVTKQETDSPGAYIFIEIRDEGCGMTPETLKRIFDPFFTTKFTGRGLGLAAVLGIIKGHHGDIQVSSQPGVGTVFQILLPESQRALPVPPPSPDPMKPQATSQVILIVDDEDSVRAMSARALKLRGFQAITAKSGMEALDLLKSQPGISLVILDLTMPTMSGEQTLPLIQAGFPGIPVILSSGYIASDVWRRFASGNIAGFLQKPYTFQALMAKVAEVLPKKDS